METTLEKKWVNNPAWFKHWFDSSFYHSLYANRNDEEAAGFIDRLLEKLAPAPQSAMLDLGCGNGRHSKYLASKGFLVNGIDLAASSIQHAKRSETNTLKFHRGDMRLPFGTNHYDYVFSFFTSFGYFKTRQEDDMVIGNIARSLKTGAVLVLDYLNCHYAVQHLVAAETKNIDGVVYHITRRATASHILKTIAIEGKQNGQAFEFTEQVKRFTLYEFDRLFRRHGLHLEQVYGNYNLDAYHHAGSPRLIMQVVKK